MAKFFINRPIVAMVISILMVIIGLVAMVQLPVALYPEIAPPEILLTAIYPGADALTLEQSVATPIEQQMSGVDNMIYMYSTNMSSGSQTQLRVDFDVTTNASTDQVLTNMRYTQAASQLPPEVVSQGVTVKKSTTSPLALFVLSSPKGTYDPLFLSNYAYVNINDPMTRVPGVGQVNIFGTGQYAVRLWVRPDTLAKLDITTSEIINALQAQNTVNPAGQVGGAPVPPGQEFTYTVRAQGRLHRAGAGRRPGRARRPELHDRGAAQRSPRRHHRHLSAARLQRHRHRESRHRAHGGGQETVPERSRLRGRPRHHAGGERGHPGDRQDALRGPRPRGHRGLHLPPGLPVNPHPAPRRARLPRGHLHDLPPPRLLCEHAIALRPRAGYRPRGRRRHRGGGGCRASHGAGALAARRRHQGDGRGLGAGGGHRPDPLRRVHPHRLHSRHYGADVPAVRGDHCRLRDDLGLQRPNPEPGALRAPPATQARGAGPARGLLPLVQPCVRARHRWLRPHLWPPDP